MNVPLHSRTVSFKVLIQCGSASNMLLWLYMTVVLAVPVCDAAKILAVLPQASHSHQITFRPIFRELVKRGHDVTYITSLPVDNPMYKQLVVKDPVLDNMSELFDLFSMRMNTWYDNIFFLKEYGEQLILSVLSDKTVQDLIHSDTHFDLIVTEALLHLETLVAFGHRFSAPVIEMQGYCPSIWAYHLVGNPYSLATTVDYYSSMSDPSRFLERLTNTIDGVAKLALHRFYALPRQQAIADQLFTYPGSESRPPLLDMLQNISLVVQNSHVAVHYPQAYSPNVIEMAGIQFSEMEDLPQDLKIFLDNATEGVIFFSTGTVLRNSLMPQKLRQHFLSAFNKVPYKVLWKWEDVPMPDKPENVHLFKWVPQKSVLAHPNMKAFITHAGLASTIEAVYHGVPTIAIPMFFDQWKNAKQLEVTGSGIILEYHNLTEHSISWAVNTITSQSSFRESAQRKSKIIRDNPQTPLDRVIFWIEYIIRHQGAPHLRTAAAGLPWYQYFLLDVIAVLVLSVILLCVLIYYALKLVRVSYRTKQKIH